MILTSILAISLASLGLFAGWVKCVRDHDAPPRNFRDLIDLILPSGWCVVAGTLVLTLGTIYQSHREDTKRSNEIADLQIRIQEGRTENLEASIALKESGEDIASSIKLLQTSDDLRRDIEEYMEIVNALVGGVRKKHKESGHPANANHLGMELLAADSYLQQLNSILSQQYDLKRFDKMNPTGHIAHMKLLQEHHRWLANPNQYRPSSVLADIPKYCDQIVSTGKELSEHFISQLKIK